MAAEPPARPRLVIVSGAPASGKTTLAARLAETLMLPLIVRDELKEVLYDTLGAPDRPASRRLGAPAFELLYHVAERLLDASVGAVLEAHFVLEYSQARLTPLIARARAVVIHCEGGLGRTGTIAGCFLALFGHSTDDILRRLVEARRDPKCPETEEQRQWLTDFAAWLVSMEAAHQAAAAGERRGGAHSNSKLP